MLDELLRVGIEGICNILLGDNRPDRLALHLFDELDCIFTNRVQGPHHQTIFDGPGRSNEGNKEWHVWDGDTKICFQTYLPFVCQVDSVLANNWKTGLIAYIEAGIADDCVNLL